MPNKENSVSKEKFLKTISKYKEYKFAKFMLDTFLRSDKFNIYKIILISIFFIFNILSIIFINNDMKNEGIIASIIGNGVLILVGLTILMCGFLDMYRAKKICKELDITIEELNNYEIIYNS